MKKTFYKFGTTLFLLLILFSFSHQTKALFLAPYFDVAITTETVGGDGIFDYSFSITTPPSALANYQENFQLETASGTASYYLSTGSGASDRAVLSQAESDDWSVVINCSSNNPAVTFNYQSNYVSMTARPFTRVTCVFTNTKKQKNPVIIIPGILSSHLNRNDDAKTELWPNIKKALFGPPGDKYLAELSLDEIGQPNLSYPVVLPTDIFRKLRDKDFFDGLITNLISFGYEENKDLFIFPYDWRLDIRASVDNVYSPILISLKDRIEQIKTQTGADKIDIVAHSMGGLLSKYYIKHYGTGKVDKFIDIGTPHLGAPSALKTLMYGDDMGIRFGLFGLNALEVKNISQNMPSAYQLLPSQNYFSTSSPDYKYYVYDMDDVDKNGVRGRLDFTQTQQFLKNTGRNELLLNNAPHIHNDLDLMNPADYGVQAYNIVGCGVPTIGKFFSLGQKHNGQYYDVSYISGDGTVPEKSARSFPSIEEYQITGVNHSGLTSSEGVGNLISNLLGDKVAEFDFITYEYVSTSTPLCKVPDGDLISFHGPVTVNIYDANQNHAGPVAGADNFEQNISGVTYDYVDDNTFIYLPAQSADNQYEIKAKANKKGKASSHIKKSRNGQVVQTFYYDNLPLDSASTTVEIEIKDGGPVVTIDPEDNSGDIITVPPSSIVDGDSLDDQDPPITAIHLEQATSTASTTITFSTDDDDTLVTEYSVDGGGTFQTATSSSPIIISDVGTTTIFYQSTDTAGNIENPQEIEIIILPEPAPPIVEIVSTITASPGHHRSSKKSEVIEEEIMAEPPQVSVLTTSLSEQYFEPKLANDNTISKIEEIVVDNLPKTEVVKAVIPYYASVISSDNSDLSLRNLFWLFIVILLLIILLLFLGKSFIKNDKIRR